MSTAVDEKKHSIPDDLKCTWCASIDLPYPVAYGEWAASVIDKDHRFEGSSSVGSRRRLMFMGLPQPNKALVDAISANFEPFQVSEGVAILAPVVSVGAGATTNLKEPFQELHVSLVDPSNSLSKLEAFIGSNAQLPGKPSIQGSDHGGAHATVIARVKPEFGEHYRSLLEKMLKPEGSFSCTVDAVIFSKLGDPSEPAVVVPLSKRVA